MASGGGRASRSAGWETRAKKHVDAIPAVRADTRQALKEEGKEEDSKREFLSLVSWVAQGMCVLLAVPWLGQLFIVAGTHIFQIIDFK
jgi:hypothetical protein